jgi:hypothetical protein
MSQEVEVKIKVDTAKAVTDVNKLGDAFDNTAQDAQDAQKVFSKAGNGVEVEQSIAGLKQLKRELKNTAVGSAEFKKLYNDIDDLEDKLKSAKNTSSDWVDSLEQAGGPLGMVGAAINKAKVATQSFGGALKATGIGLIVSLLGGLAVAFSDNEGAMKKIQPLLDGIGKIFQGVFRAVEPLFNTLVDLAINALPMVSKAFGVVYSSVTAVFQSLGMLGSSIKKLISGDFSGAWQDAKSSVNDFGKNYDASIKRFNEGSKELTKTEKDEADKRAEARRKAQEKREQEEQKARDKAIADRKAYLDKANALEDEFTLKAVDTEKIKNENDKVAMISDLENKVAIGKNYVSEKRKISEQELADTQIQAEKEMALDQAVKEAKRNALDTGLNILLQFAGKNKSVALGILAVQKGLAIADVVTGAAKAIGLAKASAAPTPINPPFLGPGVPNPAYAANLKIAATSIVATKIGAATSIASILAAGIGSASSINAGGGGGASGGGGGGAISAPASAQPSINVVGASKTNAIAETIAQQGQQPIKAYVVANDVTTQQGLDRNIVSSASIG